MQIAKQNAYGDFFLILSVIFLNRRIMYVGINYQYMQITENC